uniref:Sulfite oxidase, putative n=1 Tax=Neospora caninum (strain Liverpool) TaxID=572307 RepID=A0A0F7U3B9_NEOCL|nr:TPA: sulfite oxidase, putative [Neospora caninum Liverpool]
MVSVLSACISVHSSRFTCRCILRCIASRPHAFPSHFQQERLNSRACLVGVFSSTRYPLPLPPPCRESDLQRLTQASLLAHRGREVSASFRLPTGCSAGVFPSTSRLCARLVSYSSFGSSPPRASVLQSSNSLAWLRHPSQAERSPGTSQEGKALNEKRHRRKQNAHTYWQEDFSLSPWTLAVAALLLSSFFSSRRPSSSSSSPAFPTAPRRLSNKAFVWSCRYRSEGVLCKGISPSPPSVIASSDPTSCPSPASPPSTSPSPVALSASSPSASSPPSHSSASSFPLAGEMREDLPFYTVSDLKEHGTVGEGKRLWVAYRRGIYDVTDFLDKHPGGRDRLLLAVGRELDPFWRVYGQHNLDSVHELLESMRIGNLVKLEEASDSALEDAYGNEPLRHPALIVRSEKPFNAETPLTLLADDFFTPNDLFFVRNHLPVPQKLNAHSFSGVHFLPGSVQVDKEKYEVEIEVELPGGEKKRLASLSLSDLQTKFYPHHLPCALQCAGNRRDDFNKKGGRRVLNGAAVRSAMPSGQVWLNCFSHCSIGEEDARRLGIRHVHFEGHDCDPLTHTHYAASIPIHRALLGQTLGRWGGENEEDPFQSTTSFGSRDVLLVYEMNGRDLPPDHGAPVRVLVPGTVGARSVKWLKKITLSPRECGSHWQQQDYKIMSPTDEPSSTDEWRSKPSIVDLPVQSAICLPTPESVLPPGTEEVDLKGYAWCGGGRRVVRVDVSLDGGETWTEADLQRRPTRQENNGDAGTKMESASNETHEDKTWSW